ncbi:restriction endonuclease subunit S [Rhizobium calliandrae]|uniref:Restriction endonuclease subunit S n=1 Tax=Rhizobium calliandrae TaxID=1312182 RepID=A0ABT7KP72_9HYPH|nr:restriction endonuclease subunit S [Rhizobium calliandrae]MDL2410430.1 restriction endonuclease subunit S [Rhizobium calliandrae]
MANVQYVPLSQVATLMSGGTPSKNNPDFWNGGIPWLTPKDMSAFDGTTQDRVTKRAIGNGTRVAPDNAIFVVVRGMSLHSEIRIVHPRLPIAFNQDIKAIVPDSINSRFLYFALEAQKTYLLGSVEAAGHGTGVLPTDKLNATPIPDRSPKDQDEIGDLLGAIDDKISSNESINSFLESGIRMLFKDWFVDFGPTTAKQSGDVANQVQSSVNYIPKRLFELFPGSFDENGIPAGWNPAPLDQIASFLNGLALQKYPATGSEYLPVVKISQLRSGSTNGADRASVNIPADYVIDDEDVIFSWSGTLMQDIWTGGPGALNQHLFKVTSDQYPKWFHYFWVDYYMPEFQAIAESKATTMGHIQRVHLSQARVVVPGPEFMTAANETIDPMFRLMIANRLENRTLTSLREALLPKLMSGEVEINEAREELQS